MYPKPLVAVQNVGVKCHSIFFKASGALWYKIWKISQFSIQKCVSDFSIENIEIQDRRGCNLGMSFFAAGRYVLWYFIKFLCIIIVIMNLFQKINFFNSPWSLFWKRGMGLFGATDSARRIRWWIVSKSEVNLQQRIIFQHFKFAFLGKILLRKSVRTGK